MKKLHIFLIIAVLVTTLGAYELTNNGSLVVLGIIAIVLNLISLIKEIRGGK